MAPKIKIYDTTLRDGNQAKGLNLSLEDKLSIAKLLDDFGMDYIEGGWPNATNPLDMEFFERAHNMEWKNAKISAFGMTRRPNRSASKDPFLGFLVESKAPVLTIFGKSWDLHVEKILKCSLEENLMMIEDSIAYLKENAEEVFYDAEHFFDGYLNNPEYALKTLEAAKKGGADCIVLCDTNGGMGLSWEVEKIVSKVKKELKCPIGIHTHNDTGAAVSNSLAAVKGGAEQVQGTINGYGERCGNANLTTIIPSLQLKLGKDIVPPEKLKGLKSLSLSVSEIANLAEDIRQPYVGEAAFSHKGGAHIDGVIKVTRSFEHIEPESVGNKRDFIVSNQSGSGLVLDKIKKIKPEATKKDPEVMEILETLKKMEEDGYHFEVADGSFQLLARQKFGMIENKFKVKSYRVIEEHRESGSIYSEATVKLNVGRKTAYTVAEGSGPVDAMAEALRKGLTPFFPSLESLELEDFKVRVLESGNGTAAKVRVWIRFRDTAHNDNTGWGTIGVSENIIEASWKALLDGINYKLLILDPSLEEDKLLDAPVYAKA